MTTKARPKTYTCPKCKKVHAADLSAMEGHPEIHGKVHCIECHELLWLSLAADGSTVVEVYKEHLHAGDGAGGAAAAPKSQPAAEEPASQSSEAAQPKPSSLGPILAAAIVAAVVSFLVGMASGSGADKGGSDEVAAGSSSEALSALQVDLENLRSDADAASSKHAKLAAELHGAASGHAGSLSALQSTLAEIQTSLDGIQVRLTKVEKSYTALHGRIEMNYTNLRAARKQLDALKGK